MSALIIISSITGNTWKVGEALNRVYPTTSLKRTTDVLKCTELLDQHNKVIIGFWCDKGGLPPDLVQLVPYIRNKSLGIFATMGGNPQSDRAQECFRRQCDAVVGTERSNCLEATFLCQGKINPVLIEQMKKMPGYKETPESVARREEAAKHPNEDDYKAACNAFRAFLA